MTTKKRRTAAPEPRATREPPAKPAPVRTGRIANLGAYAHPKKKRTP